MPALARAANVTTTIFTALACMIGLYAAYKWLYFAVLVTSAWTMAEAMTWSLITMVLVVPVVVIEYIQNRGD